MSKHFQYLFSPINIGSLELENRIVMSAMHLGYATEDGFVTDRLKDFYVERAKGGAGLIVLGMAFVDWVGTAGIGTTNVIGLDDDKFIPGLKELVELVHRHGTKFAAQLYHAGRYSLSALTGLQPVSASSVPCRLNPETCRELSTAEVVTTIQKYGEAARRAKEAGFDVIEMGGSAGYIINQFLSPVTNRRKDKYGGSFRNRLRFPLEIIECIKEKVGNDFPLIYRTCGSDFLPGGLTLEDYKKVAREVEIAGVDAIGITGGWHESIIPEITMHVPRGGYVFIAEGMKEVVDIPVIAANRINEPFLAEEILRQKKADLIGMSRAILADPEFPNRAKEGRFEDIRMCIGCNQGCLDALVMGQPIQCLVNTRAGMEGQYKIEPAKRSKKVVVIGGGPAGMEAARVASLRGHQVTLYEKADNLGGQFSLASLPPGKGEFQNAVNYLSTQIMKSGVNIRLGTEVTADTIREGKFEAVIVATGAIPLIPDIVGIKRQNVVTAEDVLRDKVKVGEKVIIIGGGSVGCDVALFLSEKRAIKADNAFFLMKYGFDREMILSLLKKAGSNIKVVEKLSRIGRDIGPTTRWIALGQLEQYGVAVLTDTEAKEITDEGVMVEKDSQRSLLEADTIVLATGYQANSSLFDRLKESGMGEVYTVGDCVEPRKALDAIHDGFRIGQSI